MLMVMLLLVTVSGALLQPQKEIYTQFLQEYLYEWNGIIELYTCFDSRLKKSFVMNMWKIGNVVAIHENFDFPNFTDSAHRRYFVLDYNCSGVKSILEEKSRDSVFRRKPYHWLALNAVFDNMPSIAPNCKFSAVIFTHCCAEIYQIYEVTQGSGAVVEFEGNWSADHGFIFSDIVNKSMVSRRRNFNGAPIKTIAVALHNDSLLNLYDYKTQTIDRIGKESYSISLVIVEYLNFTNNQTLVNNWGFKDENGSWSGSVELIRRGEVDISLTAMLFTESRAEAVTFIKLVAHNKLEFFYRQLPLSLTKNIFTLPFSKNVWIATAVCIALLTTLIYLAEPYSFGELFMAAIGAVSQQGTTIEFTKPASRTAYLMLLMCMVFIYVSYSASIIVALQSTTKLKSLQDMLEAPVEVSGEDIIYIRIYMENQVEPVRRSIFTQKVRKNGFRSVPDGMDLVRQGRFAFFTDTATGTDYMLHRFTEREICSVGTLSNFIPSGSGGVWISIPQHSAYKDIFTSAYMWVNEIGIQQRQERIFMRRLKCETLTSNFESVGIEDVRPALVFLLIAICLSIGLLTTEKIFFRNKELVEKLCYN